MVFLHSHGVSTARAVQLGFEKTAVIRVRAGISYALTEAMDEGHCGLPTDELVPLAEKLLEVPQQLVRTALDLALGDLVNRDGDGDHVGGAFPAAKASRHRPVR